MTDDLRAMITLLHNEFPDQPLYLLGESMGGAVVLAAMHNEPLATEGIIILAPAIWSRQSMHLYQRYLGTFIYLKNHLPTASLP